MIKRATKEDAVTLAKLAIQMWDENVLEELAEKFRQAGFAKELLQECQRWAKKKGCTEFASDCELDNTDSFKFHMAMGFEEANRVICFKKNI